MHLQRFEIIDMAKSSSFSMNVSRTLAISTDMVFMIQCDYKMVQIAALTTFKLTVTLIRYLKNSLGSRSLRS